ncbi:hypothetical protein SNE40_007224 [Patella caerulea]|uniref:Methyltransferase type 11 domain-containing protein n=1 Tax=Patella caerulea TaxID=87958 RepID=A0AAN8PTF9_PATCE
MTSSGKKFEFEYVIGTNPECIEEREKKTAEEVAKSYDEWVEKKLYEVDMEARGYYGPQLTADTAALMFPDNREKVRIVDMAAGTGLISIKLREHGFEQIDAVDPSKVSKKVAMEKNLYGRYLVDFVDERRLDIKTDEYDGLVSSAAFTPGSMPSIALKEFIRVVKPGGYACFSTPEYVLRLSTELRDNFEPLMEKYEKEGAWKRILKAVVPSYFDNKLGVLYVFRILKSEI